MQSGSNSIRSGTIKLAIGKDIYTGEKIKNIYPGWSSENKINECMGKECSFNFVFYSFQDNVTLESEKNEDDVSSLKIIVDKNLTEDELKDGKHFLSIEKALQNAPEGVVILIEKGEYTPSGGILNIEKNVTLSGKCENSSKVAINGTLNICSRGKYDNPISIKNMTVQNIGNNKGIRHGIVLDNAQNVEINNVCCMNNYNGINIKGICSDVKIDNCNFVSNKNFGLNLEGGSAITDLSIDNCKIEKNSTGMYCEGVCSGLTIKDCLINDNKNRGLYFEEISSSFICDTEIKRSNISCTNNYKGIEVCIKDGISYGTGDEISNKISEDMIKFENLSLY